MTRFDDYLGDPVALLRVPGLSPTAQYAYAASVPAGTRLVFLAGACPLDSEGNTVGLGDIAAQARACLDNLTVALAAAGASLNSVAQTRVLVASSRQEDLVEAWNVVRERFGAHDAPSTLVGVAALGYTGQLVEIEAIAAVIDCTGCSTRTSPGPS